MGYFLVWLLPTFSTFSLNYCISDTIEGSNSDATNNIMSIIVSVIVVISC